MFLFHEIDLLQTTIKIIARIFPRVSWIMDVGVGPFVAHDDRARVCLDIGKGIQYVRKFLSWDILGRVFTPINPPVPEKNVNIRS